ncbi:uncharacterized protein LOC110837820 isoform X2 [Zootermopsis nevadensis]|uniref:uncharacterized protein LOC110837820 isoform X2 n=1 Tax=Zootermopsis nevadensis TaxID=136037 RepID=UPI000B8ED29E|nr:uncharacterized protein LOC110837820 isoform X2 [Zootermopsis nevadensis]
MNREVQSALPAIDVRPPPTHGHVCCKLKKQQREQERTTQIEQENYRLLQRMGTITQTSRLDNHWVTPPPSFLQRVGIYYSPARSDSRSQQASPPISSPDEASNRKSRCLACNPQKIKPIKSVSEERVPWKPKPQRRASQTRTSTKVTKVVTLSGMQQSKDKQTVDTSPRCITLTRGGLHLAVSFPANSAIRLQDGQLDRVLQREYCECKARSTNRETIKHQ